MPREIDAVDALRALVAFDTTSRHSNLALIDWVCDHAQACGARVHLSHDADRVKANALISIGPDREGGIVLSGHTDVVPVDGQAWSRDPFTLDDQGERLHGRGTSDMKGFIAAAVGAIAPWSRMPLRRPVHLALSYDEEVGCLGVPRLIESIREHAAPPAFVVVGEPTGMRLATAHKGFCLFQTSFQGKEAHSSLAHLGVSAVAAAVRFANYLLETGTLLSYRVSRTAGLLPAHTTFNIGLIEGGTAINIIPRRCTLKWEFRPVPDEDVAAIKSRVERFLQTGLDGEFGLSSRERGIDHQLLLEVPPLDADPRSDAARFLSDFLGADHDAPIAVPFGTEAGFFAREGMPAVVCGPGYIEQAHQPDEWIARAQLLRCVDLMRHVGRASC